MKNFKVPLKEPKPDFETFREVLEGKKKAGRVHFVELLMDEEIKKYITENLLENCMPERYAIGSGNSIANYVPVKNYLIMLDEGMNYSCP